MEYRPTTHTSPGALRPTYLAAADVVARLCMASPVTAAQASDWRHDRALALALLAAAGAIEPVE